MVGGALHILIFTLGDCRCALPLSSVEQVVRIVEITPLPEAPDTVMGVVNVHGMIVPVFNIRKRFSLPESELKLSDHMIIACTSKRRVAIIADEVGGVVEYSEKDEVGGDLIIPGLKHVKGVVKLKSGIFLICDLERFLSLREERLLRSALRGVTQEKLKGRLQNGLEQ